MPPNRHTLPGVDGKLCGLSSNPFRSEDLWYKFWMYSAWWCVVREFMGVVCACERGCVHVYASVRVVVVASSPPVPVPNQITYTLFHFNDSSPNHVAIIQRITLHNNNHREPHIDFGHAVISFFYHYCYYYYYFGVLEQSPTSSDPMNPPARIYR